MIKRILFFFLTTAFVLLINDANSQRFYGGLLAGMNGSQINGDHMSGFNKGGLLAGVFIDFPLSDQVFLSMNLNYSQKGSRSKDGTVETAGTWVMFKLSYIDIPVTVNYKINDKTDLHVGLLYGIKVGHNYTDDHGNEDPNFDPSKPGDFEICGGGNYKLNNNFKLYLRASASIVTIGKAESKPFWSKTNTGLINVVISCGIKYYFIRPK